MPINAQKIFLNVNKCHIREKETVWIEQDILVPDTKPDVVKVIKVDNKPYVTKVEVMEDKVKVAGRIAYYIIYKSDAQNGANRGIIVSYPFSESFEVKGATRNMKATVMPSVRNVIYSVPNERKISTKTEIMFKIRLTDPICINVINRFDTDKKVECKMKTEVFKDIIDEKCQIISCKEEVLTPQEMPCVYEILDANYEVTDIDYKQSYNKVLVKGELKGTILYIGEEETNVHKYNFCIPFTGFVEMENINENSKFEIKCIVESFDIMQSGDFNQTRTLCVDFDIATTVTMYEEKEVEFVEDFYTQDEEINYSEEVQNVIKNKQIMYFNLEMKEVVPGALKESNKIIDYSFDTNYITTRIANNNLYFEGAGKCNALLYNGESSNLENKTFDMVVDHIEPLSREADEEDLDIDIKLNKLSVTENGNDLEIKANLEVEATINNKEAITMLENIELKPMNLDKIDSMNIYIVKKGDSLWKIAKKYKTTVDKIATINNIENKDYIDVGQQLLIIR